MKEGNEVRTTVFVCIANNSSLLYLKAKPIFANLDPATINIEYKITSKSKVIVTLYYDDIPCDCEALKKYILNIT